MERRASVGVLDDVMEEETASGDEEEALLPPGWEMKVDGVGQIFFVDHNTRTTTRRHPGYLSRCHGGPSSAAAAPPSVMADESVSAAWRNLPI